MIKSNRYRRTFLKKSSCFAKLPPKIIDCINSIRFRGTDRLKRLIGFDTLDVEEVISEILKEFTRDKSIMIDIGAQHGRHTFAVLNSRESATVIAFEANTELANKLRDQLSMSSESIRAKVINSAVSDSDGITKFFINIADSGYSGLVPRNIAEVEFRYNETYVVSSKIDSTFADSNVPISTIKIDVEGAELAVLNGAYRTICNNKPLIVFECARNASTFYGSNLKDIYNWFVKIEYEVFTIYGSRLDEWLADYIFSEELCFDFFAVPSKNGEFVSNYISGEFLQI